jgi:RimJ/RimL family protein N-acetyltransferase
MIRPETIVTERLTLLPLRVEHAEEMSVVLADPALHAFIGGTPATSGELRARYARMLAGAPDPAVSWCNWVVQVRRDGPDGGRSRDPSDPARATAGPAAEEAAVAEPLTLAGTIQATITSDPGIGTGTAPRTDAHAPVAVLAWVVGTAWQRQGIATEAAHGLVGWLENRGVRTFVAHIHPDHRASATVARAVGLNPTDDVQDGEVVWRRHVGA